MHFKIQTRIIDVISKEKEKIDLINGPRNRRFFSHERSLGPLSQKLNRRTVVFLNNVVTMRACVMVLSILRAECRVEKAPFREELSNNVVNLCTFQTSLEIWKSLLARDKIEFCFFLVVRLSEKKSSIQTVDIRFCASFANCGCMLRQLNWRPTWLL